MNKIQKFKNSLFVSFILVAFFMLIIQFPIVLKAQDDNQTINNLANDNLTDDKEENIFIADKKLVMNVTDIELEIAPGQKVKTWAFNNTVPGPPLRFTEAEKVTIEFVNNSTFPHTLHFHGIHDEKNDGVLPVISPGQSYLYNITAEPAGTLMYHCHTMPVSDHIRMGMYGIMVVDPKEPLPPAKEYYMVISEFSHDENDLTKFIADSYPINGYSFQYMNNPLEINQTDLLRLYVINMGSTIPTPLHLHSTIFQVYPSGLLSNQPYNAQTIPIATGDAVIIEAKWKYPGTYLFHSHGVQEEKGNMGKIIIHEDNDITEGITDSISMFDWQYDLQRKLQTEK
ncbi:MAG: multicopper oxidase domain-containing protein [Nitrososphaeraceae archaeon]